MIPQSISRYLDTTRLQFTWENLFWQVKMNLIEEAEWYWRYTNNRLRDHLSCFTNRKEIFWEKTIQMRYHLFVNIDGQFFFSHFANAIKWRLCSVFLWFNHLEELASTSCILHSIIEFKILCHSTLGFTVEWIQLFVIAILLCRNKLYLAICDKFYTLNHMTKFDQKNLASKNIARSRPLLDMTYVTLN